MTEIKNKRKKKKFKLKFKLKFLDHNKNDKKKGEIIEKMRLILAVDLLERIRISSPFFVK